MNTVQATAEKVINNVEKVIIGKHEEIKLTLVGLLCRGHLLIEDVPGVGKTEPGKPPPSACSARSSAPLAVKLRWRASASAKTIATSAKTSAS